MTLLGNNLFPYFSLQYHTDFVYTIILVAVGTEEGISVLLIGKRINVVIK